MNLWKHNVRTGQETALIKDGDIVTTAVGGRDEVSFSCTARDASRDIDYFDVSLSAAEWKELVSTVELAKGVRGK